MKAVDKQAFGTRLAQRRLALDLTQEQVADAVGMSQQGVVSIEGGDVERPRRLRELALLLKTTEDWLLYGDGPQEVSPALAADRAIMGGPVNLNSTVPVFGHAEGGKDGEFPFNGNEIGRIPGPASLYGVRDAYAVYVVGDSMDPRYQPGEAVFVNPRLPVRRGDYVVAQIAAGEGSPPLAYVKRFVAREARHLKLEQFNPRKILEFPAQKVVSIHRIVMGGDR